MKHTFTVTAEYTNGFDGKVIVEVLDPDTVFKGTIGEGYADTLQEAVRLAFQNLDLPTTK